MADKLSKKEFYAKYYPMVKDSVKGTPLHPETVIAQMAIESGWGGSGLTSKYNNFFGVKGKGTPKLLTEEERGGKRESEKASFRAYDSAEDSIKDYVKLLTTDSRYKDVLKAKTPEEQALAIGNTPYSTSSTYGQTILSTVKANKSLAGNKQTTMAKNGKNLNDIIKNKKSKVEYLKNRFGEDSEEYKSEKNKLDLIVAKDVYDKQSLRQEDINSRLEVAEKSGNWDEANKIATELKDFESNKIDFTKTKDTLKSISNESIDKDGKIHGFGSRVVGYGKESDLDFDKIYSQYDSYNSSEDKDPYSTTAENLEDITGDKVGGGSGSSSSSSTTTVDVDDLGSTGGVPADVDDVPATEELDINTQIANKQTELDALEPYNQQAFDDTYAPDFQNDSDLLGTVMDAGRGIMGMIGANEEIPEYSRGAMFSQAMGDAAQMRNEGLSADELAYRERQGEEAFGYDVKNIRRLAGGSGGVALANLGRATGQLYDNKSRTAAEDEGARRMNRQNFQQMALQDENINRRIFEDDLRQAEMTKQAGSQLIQDALGNIKEREDYNKQFGKGSVYYEYNKEKTLDTRSSRIDRENANQRRVSMLKKQTTDDLNKLIKQRDEKQSITADSTFDTVENIRGGGTISKRSSDLDTNPYGGSEVADDLIKLSQDREEQKRLSAEAEADALISGGKSKSLFRKRKNKK